MHEIELRGIDGSNLLGYMAALGTLRVLTLARGDSQVRMRWADRGVWTPFILHSGIAGPDELVAAVADRVCGEETVDAAWHIGDDLKLSLAEFRAKLLALAQDASPQERESADFMAAFGSEVYGSGPKRQDVADTDFRTMSGAGHQHFVGFMRELAALTSPDHIRRALLCEWDYADDRPSLRWDPADFRPHALRAEDPSGDPIRTIRGANRLAVESLPLFPTAVVRGRVRTSGFVYDDDDVAVSCPIWADALDMGSIGSLLVSREVQDVDGFALRRRGVAQVFRSRRFTEGKYRNFSPSRAIL